MNTTTAVILIAFAAAAVAVAPSASAFPLYECGQGIDAVCYYDHDNDPATTDQICIVSAPELATLATCRVG